MRHFSLVYIKNDINDWTMKAVRRALLHDEITSTAANSSSWTLVSRHWGGGFMLVNSVL